MEKILDWLKKNKLVVFLLLVIGYLVWSNQILMISPRQKSVGYDMAAPSSVDSGRGGLSLPIWESAPQPDIDDRMVVEQSNISLVVDDVRQKTDEIIAYAENKGGYMVSSSITRPEEIPFGTLVVRVPNEELRPALEYLRGLSIKVTSESLTGRDVTDQYIDIEERLATLETTRQKFEEILADATQISDILEVQRELINLQDQIDRLKGQQEYLERTAENSKITIYLSTDEWALPFGPEGDPFRPGVIFKQAVRSLVSNTRRLGRALIWVGVYTPIWLPALLLIWWWKKKATSKQ